MQGIYRVAFYKRLVDSNGHTVDASQAVLEVSGPNKERAITDARLRFAELNGVGRWSLRAQSRPHKRLMPQPRKRRLSRVPQLHIIASKNKTLRPQLFLGAT